MTFSNISYVWLAFSDHSTPQNQTLRSKTCQSSLNHEEKGTGATELAHSKNEHACTHARTHARHTQDSKGGEMHGAAVRRICGRLFARLTSRSFSMLAQPDQGHLWSRTPRKACLENVSTHRARSRIKDISGLDHRAEREFGAHSFPSGTRRVESVGRVEACGLMGRLVGSCLCVYCGR